MQFYSKSSYDSIEIIYPAISLIDKNGKVNYCRLNISQDKHNNSNPLRSHISLDTPNKEELNTSNIKIKTLQFKEEKLKNSKSMKLNIPLPKKLNNIKAANENLVPKTSNSSTTNVYEAIDFLPVTNYSPLNYRSNSGKKEYKHRNYY